RLRLVRELLDVHDGSEDLLSGDSHGGIRVDERGRFVVPSLLEGLALRPLAAEREFRSFVRADFDVVLDLLPLLRRDERPEVRRSLERVAHADRLEPLDELVLELLVDLVLDDETRGLRAILAAVHHGGRDGSFRRGGNVRVLEDDEGGLAAQLQVELLHVRGRRFHDLIPVAVSPVRETMSTLSLDASSFPTTAPGPVIRFTVPAGIPAASISLPSSSVVSGVSDAGFRTAVFPAASAGASFQIAIMNG